MRKWIETGLAGLVLVVAACSGGPDTGPGEVRWDQDVCARCIMAVSDRHFSAQVRGGPAGVRTKLYFFDDLGCAVLWLEQQEWRDDPRTEMWVNDSDSGEWLDAFAAYYEPGNITPMDFGLGARPDAVAGALDYGQAVQVIHDRERRHH